MFMMILVTTSLVSMNIGGFCLGVGFFFWYLIVCHVLNLFLSFMYFVFQIKKIILVNRLEATVKHVCVRWRLLAWQQV